MPTYTVSELIETLQQLNPSHPVFIQTNNGERHEIVSVGQDTNLAIIESK